MTISAPAGVVFASPDSSGNGLVTTIVMPAPAATIFNLVRDVENWASMLPHYRSVKLVNRDGADRELDMTAMRGLIPVGWRSIVHAEESVPKLTFVHTGGFTKGMHVAWHFEPYEAPGSTVVTISHDPDGIANPLRRWLTERILGHMVINPIARRTLARFRDLVAAL